MLKNIFTTSFRALLKRKSAFFLNIFGLSVGIAACIIAYQHIRYELSYDSYYSKQDQLFRLVVGNMETGEGWVKVSAPIPEKLKSEIPEIESYARMTEYSYDKKQSVKYLDKEYIEKNVFLADTRLFDLLDMSWHSGSVPREVAKNDIFISTTVATKIFKNQDPINKNIKINNNRTYKIAGVFESLPENNHLTLDYIVPFIALEEVLPGTSLTGGWGQFNYFAYLELSPTADSENVISKIKSTVVEFGNDQQMRFEQLTLQPIADIHFQGSPGNTKASYDKRYLFIYGTIALAIFIISIINFLNLSIATSSHRIKEVGVRKVMGARKDHLTFQFMAEGTILASISIAIGLLLAQASLPFINQLIGSSGSINFADPILLVMFLGIMTFISISAGLYMSFFVLSASPVNALRGASKSKEKRGLSFKNGLLATQFLMASILILSSIFIYQQLNFLKDKNLGLQSEQLITIELFDTSSIERIATLKSELKKLPGVEAAGLSRFTPGASNWNQTVTWTGQQEETQWNIIEAGPDFIDVYGIELHEGDKDFISNISNEQITYLVNESAVNAAMWEQPVGTEITAYGKNGYAAISGVVKDFHYRSLHNQIEPLAIIVRESPKNNLLTLRANTNDYSSLLKNIEEVHLSIFGSATFEYAFVDEQFEQLYTQEAQTGKLIGLLTGIAILLAVLGTYALVSFTIKERTKEIAIRKVLGISLSGTLMLLSKKYVKILLISNVIGVVLTILAINSWLENFSYHITPGIAPSLIGVAACFSVILLVIGLKSFQTETINPAEALKDE